MALEIERKFLVEGTSWREADPGSRYLQGYLCFGPPVSVRIRIAEGKARLTVKRPAGGISRDEFEYEIPIEDGEALLSSAQGTVIEKTRYKIPYAGHTWEVDEFHGANQGLLVAEIELDHPDSGFDCPPWVGKEVTSEARYLNACLARHPYTKWLRKTR